METLGNGKQIPVREKAADFENPGKVSEFRQVLFFLLIFYDEFSLIACKNRTLKKNTGKIGKAGKSQGQSDYVGTMGNKTII